MPSRPVQGYPVGFLSLLGLKNLGKLPDVLLDEVRPSFDVTGWYLRGIRVPITQDVLDIGTGVVQTIFITTRVPEGEVWFVHSSLVRIEPGAAGNHFVSLVIEDRNGQFRAGVLVPQPLAIPAIAERSDFWLYPGDRLVAQVMTTALSAINISAVYASRLLT